MNPCFWAPEYFIPSNHRPSFRVNHFYIRVVPVPGYDPRHCVAGRFTQKKKKKKKKYRNVCDAVFLVHSHCFYGDGTSESVQPLHVDES